MACGNKTHGADSTSKNVGGIAINSGSSLPVKEQGIKQQLLTDYMTQVTGDIEISAVRSEGRNFRMLQIMQNREGGYFLYPDFYLEKDGFLEDAYVNAKLYEYRKSSVSYGWSVERDENNDYVVKHDGVEDPRMTSRVNRHAGEYRDVRGAKNFVESTLMKEESDRLHQEGAELVNTALNKVLSTGEELTKEESRILDQLSKTGWMNMRVVAPVVARVLERRDLLDIAGRQAKKNDISVEKAWTDVESQVATGALPHCGFCGRFVSPESKTCTNPDCGRTGHITNGFNSLTIPPQLNDDEKEEARRLAALVRTDIYDADLFTSDLLRTEDRMYQSNAVPSTARRAEVYNNAAELLSEMTSNDLTPDFEFPKWNGVEKEISPIELGVSTVGAKIGNLSIVAAEYSLQMETGLNDYQFHVGDSTVYLVPVRAELLQDFAKEADKITDWDQFDKMTEFEKGLFRERVDKLAKKFDGTSPESIGKLIRPMNGAGRLTAKAGFEGNIATADTTDFITDGASLMKSSAFKDKKMWATLQNMKHDNREKKITAEKVDPIFESGNNMDIPLKELGFYTNNNYAKIGYLVTDDGQTAVGVNAQRYNFMKKHLDHDQVTIGDENSRYGRNAIAFKKNGELVGFLMAVQAPKIDISTAQKTLSGSGK